MKEIVIMVGPAGPDQRLINMLEQLFPECTIRLVQAGSRNVKFKGDSRQVDISNQKTNNG
jgi:hypothetical protein